MVSWWERAVHVTRFLCCVIDRWEAVGNDLSSWLSACIVLEPSGQLLENGCSLRYPLVQC